MFKNQTILNWKFYHFCAILEIYRYSRNLFQINLEGHTGGLTVAKEHLLGRLPFSKTSVSYYCLLPEATETKMRGRKKYLKPQDKK